MKDYPVGGRGKSSPYEVSLLSGNIEERQLPTYLARLYRKDTQVFHITQTSATAGPRHIQRNGAVDNFSKGAFNAE
jgi:hypothetical protein